jgi:F420-dependent oxidoreductase-like protein
MATERLSRRRFLKGLGAATAVATVAGRISLPQPAHAASSSSTPAMLRFGVQTPPQYVNYADIVQVWKEADELGFNTAFVFDHFIPIYSDPNGPCLEGWTLLSALAAQTKNVKVGVLVTGNTYRNPAVLAKMAATVDHVSNGRLILGLGAAWFELEHTAYGIPFYTPGERARRLVEAVEVMKLLFTQPKSNFNGKYYQLKDALFEPKTVQKPYPPLLIGGTGPKVIQPLAARHANIWHFFVRDGDPQETKKACMNFDEICRKVGRDPTQVEKSVSLRPPQLTGSTAEVRGHIQALVDAGIQHFIISLPSPYDQQLLRRFAKEVMPAFRTT